MQSASNSEATKSETGSHLNGVRCGWCAYEISGNGAAPSIPRATTTIEIRPGQFRQVCSLHATMRGWRARARRIGAVAP